jgi:acyl dehydratase
MPALSYAELPTTIGTTLGPSRWIPISQARINAFADATEDHQWIHIDPARAVDGPFGITIGHGYLTLSLISAYLEEILEVEDADSVINYGADRVRFPSPVPVDSQLRATGEIVNVTNGPGWSQLTVRVTIERNGGARPACVADVLIRYLAPKGN